MYSREKGDNINLSAYLSIRSRHAMRQITLVTGGKNTSYENYAIERSYGFGSCQFPLLFCVNEEKKPSKEHTVEQSVVMFSSGS